MASLKNKLKINKVTTLSYQINFRFILDNGATLPIGASVYAKLKPKKQKGTEFLPVVCDGLPIPFYTDTPFESFKLLIKIELKDEGNADEKGDIIQSNIVRHKFASLADYNPDLPFRITVEIRKGLKSKLALPTSKTIVIGSEHPMI